MVSKKVTEYKGGWGRYSIPISHNDFLSSPSRPEQLRCSDFPYSTGIEISLLSEVSLPSVALVLGPKCAELYFHPQNALMAYCSDTALRLFLSVTEHYCRVTESFVACAG